jgi:hypothetical protein
MNEFVLWGLPKGSSDRLDERVLTSTTDRARIDQVKKLATADGWHSYRIQTLDGTLPDFVGAITTKGTP